MRPSSSADRRALVTPDRVPLDRQPPLPKRTPGIALDEVHRNSIIQISRDQLADGADKPVSDRWFRANRPEASADPGDTSSSI
ncbi:hypothetical protein [Cryptosporangium sp. NPDC051539]|uniref:hypothetical protein n=1 Tax=Cryptosporangium sp. NPDC051539 TaxID=3363962 RepID=UPI0037A8E6EE